MTSSFAALESSSDNGDGDGVENAGIPSTPQTLERKDDAVDVAEVSGRPTEALDEQQDEMLGGTVNEDATESDEQDARAADGQYKRCSKKAERRAARKNAKSEKRHAREQESKCVANQVPDASMAEWDDAVPKISKAAQKRQKELQRQERREQNRHASRAEEEELAASLGGILDARFRRRVLQCPTEIAPVTGRTHVWEIATGFVPGMRAPARFFANEKLASLCIDEIKEVTGGFLPAVRQLANVATLPGLMGFSLGMPDIHSGYGFAVGSVAAVDLTNPDAVVSPGGVGFDINCGVRLLRTDVKETDLRGSRCEELATAIFKAVPSGVGAGGAFSIGSGKELREVLQRGMGWALDHGYCWEEDLQRTEENGVMQDADVNAVSSRAMKRGSPQLGTLGSGNHYLELQVVDEIFDDDAAHVMGLTSGNVCVMIHCGSRGIGHQLCTDYLQTMDTEMRKQGISVPDRQLCCVRAESPQGRKYLAGMAAAANYAFVNRTLIAHSVREAFRQVLNKDPFSDLRMSLVYDVSHNIAKREEHVDPADGTVKPALVHRKGATRSFPPGHEALPEVYRDIGQPVLIGGSMGTCSYVLAGCAGSMELSFGSTCHGAGRQMSRAQALRTISGQAVLAKLRQQGVEVRVASPKMVAEESDESYKDVTAVVRTCHEVGLSRMVARLRPLAVIKG